VERGQNEKGIKESENNIKGKRKEERALLKL
jgi:hypothetical protein